MIRYYLNSGDAYRLKLFVDPVTAVKPAEKLEGESDAALVVDGNSTITPATTTSATVNTAELANSEVAPRTELGSEGVTAKKPAASDGAAV